MGLAVLAVALLIAALLPTVSGVAGAQPTPTSTPQADDSEFDQDPAVRQAQSNLDEARAQLETVTERLDVLAGEYEQARAHVQRLADELEDSPERINQAEEATRQARSAQAEQVRAAYMQPGLDFTRVSSAFLLAPDVNTALHTTAVMQRVAAAKAREVQVQIDADRRVIDDVANQRQIAGGTSSALADLEELTTTFTQALDVAMADVAAAEESLADARADVRDEARRQAQAAADQERRQQQAAQQQSYLDAFSAEPGSAEPGSAEPGSAETGSAEPGSAEPGDVSATEIRIATINGESQEMTCPLGQPNGFTDSWGFPRSGGRTHKGVDMFASYGMPVFAAADGVVRRVFNNTLGGLSIDLVDGLGHRYYYAHLSAAYVRDGQQVVAGELLAANGNSGNAISTPPHVHWQFHPNDGDPVNPFPLAAALCR